MPMGVRVFTASELRLTLGCSMQNSVPGSAGAGPSRRRRAAAGPRPGLGQLDHHEHDHDDCHGDRNGDGGRALTLKET
jgi:hypothetical protein